MGTRLSISNHLHHIIYSLWARPSQIFGLQNQSPAKQKLENDQHVMSDSKEQALLAVMLGEDDGCCWRTDRGACRRDSKQQSKWQTRKAHPVFGVHTETVR
jgi:hypothetical protein